MVENIADISPDKEVVLDFDPGNAFVSRVDNDLIFIAEGQEPLILKDFFIAEGNSLPALVLPDGAKLGAEEFLHAFDIDISPAAGPQTSTRPLSSGLDGYAEPDMSVIDSVERLEHLHGLGDYDNAIATDAATVSPVSNMTALGGSVSGSGAGSGAYAEGDDVPGSGAGSGAYAEGDDVPGNGAGSAPGVGPVASDISTELELSGFGVFGDGGQRILGDWSEMRGSNSMFNKSSAWLSSEPPHRNGPAGETDINQNSLYDIVTSNEASRGKGVDPRADLGIDLLPAPVIPGANDAYIHMKDCGIFRAGGRTNLQVGFKHDELVTSEAFGLKAAEMSKKAISGKIDDILTKLVGIEPDAKGLSDNSGNYDWNLLSRHVTSSGGEVRFGWSFQGGDPDYGNDAAFWVLKNVATEQVISGGLLAQGNANASGIATIQLPTGHSGEYVLTIGMMNVGAHHVFNSANNPHLLIGTVVQNEASFMGDLLPEPGTVLGEVGWDGEYYDFMGPDAKSSYRFERAEGSLVVNADGTYYFVTPDGSKPSFNFHGMGVFREAEAPQMLPFELNGDMEDAAGVSFTFTATGEIIDQAIPVSIDDEPHLLTITYRDVEHRFGDGEYILSVPTEHGALEVTRNGTYLYMEKSADALGNGAEFTYLLEDKDGDLGTGSLHIGAWHDFDEALARNAFFDGGDQGVAGVRIMDFTPEGEEADTPPLKNLISLSGPEDTLEESLPILQEGRTAPPATPATAPYEDGQGRAETPENAYNGNSAYDGSVADAEAAALHQILLTSSGG